MTAQPLAPAPEIPHGAATGGLFGWLTPAVEDAALASGNWPLTPEPASLARTWPPRVVTITPGTQDGAIRDARDFAVAVLRRWGISDRGGDIALVVSELLTNALRHGSPGLREAGAAQVGQPIRLGVTQPGPWVLCAVFDPCRRPPVAQDSGVLDETGRGLHIVEALSDHWGWAALPGRGKLVWAMFSATPGQAC